jgi:uncharacterized membrane protein YhiD involved in acid resistance
MNPRTLVSMDITPAHAALSLLLAFALAFLWATVYRKTHTGVAYSRSFFVSLVLIAPIVTMIMLAIGSNVALSLGLVGSLSVIRFRTVIRDTKDMTFLFLGIGIGLCSGANAWMVAIIGTALVSTVVILMNRLGHGRAGSSDYILVFRSDEKEPWERLTAEARQMVSWRQLRGAADVDTGREFEYTYSVRLAPSAAPERIVNAVSNCNGIRRVTLIAPENHLEV